MGPANNGEPELDLTVTRSVIQSPTEFSATAVLTAGNTSITWNRYLAEISALSLKIKDAKGELIPHLPPPLPDPEAVKSGKITTATGKTGKIQLRGLAVAPDFLPTGNIQVQLVVDYETPTSSTAQVFSEWIKVEVLR